MDNLTNPALLFFVLGIFASQIGSDLKIPANSSKFISLYLLLCIGFNGGQELSHQQINNEVIWSMVFAGAIAFTIPFIAFFLLKKYLSVENSGAIAAAYGSVSAVTFVTTIAFLEFNNITYSAHMIAVMAIMEAPAIISGILLIRWFSKEKNSQSSMGSILKHSLTNSSVLIVLGSLVIGFLANESQAQGIKPFTTDIFVGFLSVFLLDMGITSGKYIGSLFKKGITPFIFAIVFPFFTGISALFVAGFFTSVEGNLILFAILAASASYIAVPAAMKNAVPNANPGLYLPMALGITFPLNIILGIPFYREMVVLIY